MNLKKDEDIIHGLTESEWFYDILYSPDDKDNKLFLFFVTHKLLSVTFRLTVSFAQPYFHNTGWWTANKARQSSLYIIYSFIYFCMRNTQWKSPANRAPVSPWKRQRGLYTKCLNISKQSLSFVSYTSAIKHTNSKWKTNCLGSIDSKVKVRNLYKLFFREAETFVKKPSVYFFM